MVFSNSRSVFRRAYRNDNDPNAGHEVTRADNELNGYELAANDTFDCVILDVLLPGRNGLDVLADLRDAGGAQQVRAPVDLAALIQQVAESLKTLMDNKDLKFERKPAMSVREFVSLHAEEFGGRR